jgi:hypothetical protein
MDCLEFRRSAGADPQHLAADSAAHADACARCAEYLRQTRALDARILAALRVPVPADGAVGGSAMGSARPVAVRGRWLAFAASIVGGVLVGSLLWVSAPRDSLASDLVAHMGHEPGVMVATQAAADAQRLAAVLGRGGIRLRPGSQLVSYASSCTFRGHRVPHLVVQTDAGPVTVMVLPNDPVPAPVEFAEEGYVGRILPSGPGSVAVIGPGGTDLTQVAERVAAAIEWQAALLPR